MRKLITLRVDALILVMAMTAIPVRQNDADALATPRESSFEVQRAQATFVGSL